MSQPVTVRLPEPFWEELRQIARREQRSISEVGARFIKEGLRQSRFPYIEFRSFQGERHACIKGALPVWQLIMVAKDYGMDVDKIAYHLDLKPEQVKAGMHYYEAYPEEIDRVLAENDRGYEQLKAMLPTLQRVTLPSASENKAGE